VYENDSWFIKGEEGKYEIIPKGDKVYSIRGSAYILEDYVFTLYQGNGCVVSIMFAIFPAPVLITIAHHVLQNT